MKDLSLKLAVVVMKQGKRFVVYSPALDLSTSGKTEKQAKKRFEEAVEVFFEEIIEAGTASEVLRDLGWEREKKQWQPPQIISKETMPFSMPALA